MSKKKRTRPQLSNQFFDEMQEMMQADDAKKRKLSSEVRSQPELQFLQFKPQGKENFTSFSSNAYFQPNVTNTNKRSWRPPVKLCNGNMSSGKSNIKDQLKHNQSECKSNTELSDNRRVNIDYNQTQSGSLVGDLYKPQLTSTSRQTNLTEPTSTVTDINNDNIRYMSNICESPSQTSLKQTGGSFAESKNDEYIDDDECLIQKEDVTSQFMASPEVKRINQQSYSFPETTQEYDQLDNGQELEMKAIDTTLPTYDNSSKFLSTIQSVFEEAENHNEIAVKQSDNNEETYNCCSTSEVGGASKSVDCDDDLTQGNMWNHNDNFESNDIMYYEEKNEEFSENCGSNNYNTVDEKLGSSKSIEENNSIENQFEKDDSINIQKHYDTLHHKRLSYHDKIEALSQINVRNMNLFETDYINCKEDKDNEEGKCNTDNVFTGSGYKISSLRKDDCAFVNENYDNKYEELKILTEEELDKMKPILTTTITSKENNYSKNAKEMYNDTNSYDINISKDFKESFTNYKYNKTMTEIDPDDNEAANRFIFYVSNEQCKEEETYPQICETTCKNNLADTVFSEKGEPIKLDNDKFIDASTNNFRIHDYIERTVDDLLVEKSEPSLCNSPSGHYSKNKEKAYSTSNQSDVILELNEDSNHSQQSNLVVNEEKESVNMTIADGTFNNEKSVTIIKPILEQQQQQEIQTKDGGSNLCNEDVELDDENSYLMISNSQLLEIEQRYYEASKEGRSTEVSNAIKCDPPGYDQQPSIEYSKKAVSVGTQTEPHNAQPPVVPQPLHNYPSAQWSKKMQDTQKQLRDTIQEIGRLNSILLKLRKEIWPRRNIT